MPHPVILAGSKPLRYQDSESAAQSVEPSGHKEHERSGASDSRKCIYTNELAGHDGVGHIIKLLKYISQKYRDHKTYDHTHRAAGGHVTG